MNVATVLTQTAASRPDHPALIFEGRTTSYAELDEQTGRFASALGGLGVGRAGVVAIFLESGPELLISYLGAIRAGAVPNVVNGSLKAEEVRAIVADSGAEVLVTDTERWAMLGPVPEGLGTRVTLLAGRGASTGDELDFQETVDRSAPRPELLECEPEDLASLLYTSGTTGRPKGVMLSHRNILDNALQFGKIHYAQDDRLLVAAPLFHCWGLINGVLGMMGAGGTSIVMRRFQTEPALDLIASSRPTAMMGVPVMFSFMARSPTRAQRDLTSLRFVLSAAAPTPLDLIETLRRDWKVGYAESYGLTETSPVITTTHHTENRPGSCGRAMGDTRLKVVGHDGSTLPVGEVGELWASGTAISAGYYKQPETTAAVFTPDGWFRTGDVVRMDDQGYVFIVDRVKDMINVAGEKVYPRDVEEVLHRHPAVADAVIVGVPDPDRGEAVKAFIALKPGHTGSQEEMIAFLKPLVASFKLPRAVKFVDSIPRSPSGKALRRLLR